MMPLPMPLLLLFHLLGCVQLLRSFYWNFVAYTILKRSTILLLCFCAVFSSYFFHFSLLTFFTNGAKSSFYANFMCKHAYFENFGNVCRRLFVYLHTRSLGAGDSQRAGSAKLYE